MIEKLKRGFYPLLGSLFYSIKDYFKKNYSYHSSALTFYFLLSVFPLFIFIFSIVSLLAFLNISYVYYIFYNLFPSIAEKFLDTVIKFYSTNISTHTSIVSILISLYFSKDLFIAIQMAFSYVWEIDYRGDKKNLIISIISLPVLSLILIFFYGIMIFLKFLNEIRTFLEKLDLFFTKWILFFINFVDENINLIFQILNFSKMLIMWFFIFLLFYFFTPSKVSKKEKYVSSILTALLLIILEYLFEKFIISFLSKSPLFFILGSVFAFLIWVKISFDIILIGQRFLYYYSKYPEGQNLPENNLSRV